MIPSKLLKITARVCMTVSVLVFLALAVQESMKLREGNEAVRTFVQSNEHTNTTEDIAMQLLNKNLSYFMSRRYVSRIEDYRIDSIIIDYEEESYFIFTAEFAVRVAESDSNWLRDAVGVEGDWIQRKTVFRVNVVDDTYYLAVM